MTIGSSCYACRNKHRQESKPYRRCWSFCMSKRSGLPIRLGRGHGRVLSDGSRIYDRSSPDVPIAAFVSVLSDLARPERGATRRFRPSSTGRSGTARPEYGTSCVFWLIGSHPEGSGGSCEACSAFGRARTPPKRSTRRMPVADAPGWLADFAIDSGQWRRRVLAGRLYATVSREFRCRCNRRPLQHR